MDTEKLAKFWLLQGQDGTKAEREKLLKEMSDSELDYLIKYVGNQSGRIYYSSFKSKYKTPL